MTNKLIWEVVEHIRFRGISPPNIGHLRKVGLSNVCELCYDIIVAEHNLIEIENDLASLLNIDSLNVDKGEELDHLERNKNIWDEEDFQGDAVEIPKLKAWRLFFYLERVKYTDSLLCKKPVSLSL